MKSSSDFKTHNEFIKYKDENHLCSIDGCINSEHHVSLCLDHEEDEYKFFHICAAYDCSLMVPIILSYCSFHGGTTYTSDMKQRLLDAIKPKDNTLIVKKIVVNSVVKLRSVLKSDL